MFNTSILDVATGLVFIYLLLGLVCTTVNEWIAQALKTRAGTLEEAIRRMLHAPPDGTYLFRTVDINIAALTKRFNKPDDKLTKAVGEFPDEVSHDIASYAVLLNQNPASPPPPGLAVALMNKLNDALKDPNLNQKIDDSKVAEDTRNALARQPKDNKLLRWNRTLLGEAFPDEITSLSDAFYSHPLIKSLARPGKRPSYVPADTFALTLLDIFNKGQAAAGDASTHLEQIKIAIAALPDSDVKVSVLALMRTGTNSVESVQKKLENWFNVSMDRASGLYKRKTQIWTIVVASAVTILANADTINIAQKLLINPTLREKIVQDATATAKAKNARDAAGTADNAQTAAAPTTPNSPGLTQAQKADLGDLTGWADELSTFHNLTCQDKSRSPAAVSACEDQARNGDSTSFSVWDLFKPRLWTALFFPWLWTVIPKHVVGWALTATAASLGAPFWFDTLNKFMNVRSVGASPDEKKPAQVK